MDEQSTHPVERYQTVDAEDPVLQTPAGTARELPGRRRSFAFVWVLLLALLVGALAWYALSRGEPQELEVPDLENATIELPSQAPEVQVEVPEAASDGG